MLDAVEAVADSVGVDGLEAEDDELDDDAEVLEVEAVELDDDVEVLEVDEAEALGKVLAVVLEVRLADGTLDPWLA